MKLKKIFQIYNYTKDIHKFFYNKIIYIIYVHIYINLYTIFMLFFKIEKICIYFFV